MINRKVYVDSVTEQGEMGEVKHDSGHTYITKQSIRIHIFYIIIIFEGTSAKYSKKLELDEAELDALLEYNFKSGEINRAFDRLSNAERLRTIERCCHSCGALRGKCQCKK